MVPDGAATVLFPLTLSGPVCVIFPPALVALSVLAVALPRSTLPLAPTVSAPGVLTTPRVRLPGTFCMVTFDPPRDKAESNSLPVFVSVTAPVPPEMFAGPVRSSLVPAAWLTPPADATFVVPEAVTLPRLIPP